jgi:hypothetical protein
MWNFEIKVLDGSARDVNEGNGKGDKELIGAIKVGKVMKITLDAIVHASDKKIALSNVEGGAYVSTEEGERFAGLVNFGNSKRPSWRLVTVLQHKEGVRPREDEVDPSVWQVLKDLKPDERWYEGKIGHELGEDHLPDLWHNGIWHGSS